MSGERHNFELLSSHISYQTQLGVPSKYVSVSYQKYFPKERKNINQQLFSLFLDTFQGEISKHFFSDKKFL